MKTNAILILFLISGLKLFAQTQITGKLIDENKQAIIGANVYLLNTFDGANTDTTGVFKIKTNKAGAQILVASFIGYKTIKQAVNLDAKKVEINLALQPDAAQISTVTITAGAFEASDTKKGTVLKPLDIVTTAFGVGDIYGAINTLPGTQKVGEKGELFVRGGESYETKTFIDGLMVQKPYSSNMPDLPSRGRFSPFLFKGTVFSSGGYSAEYGQALSSALILQTDGMPTEDLTSLSLMAVGLGLQQTKVWDKASISASLDYTDLSPYYGLVKQGTSWEKAPRAISGSVIHRLKTGKTGLLKLYTTFSQSYARLQYPDFDNPGATQTIGLGSRNFFLNMSHKMMLTDKITLNSSLGISDDQDITDINKDQLKNKLTSIDVRYTMTYMANEWLNLKWGNEMQARKYFQNYFTDEDQDNKTSQFRDFNHSMFVEGELSLGPKFAARVGARGEYASVVGQYNLAPRASLAYKTSDYAQISLGYGIFKQTPQDDYLRFNRSLDFEQANHYILNYQWMRNNRIFRVEGYYKDYLSLVKYDAANPYVGSSYNNKGNGYARGLDVFYRDQTSFKNTDLWVSYSFIDTKRNYKDFPVSAVPNFVSTNNFSFVCKYWVPKMQCQFSLSYVFADGRTYVNPNNPNYLSDKTKPFNDLSLACSYLTTIHKHFTILYVSVSNALGSENIYGYHYSTKMVNGAYEAYPIQPAAKRFLFAGLFISIK